MRHLRREPIGVLFLLLTCLAVLLQCTSQPVTKGGTPVTQPWAIVAARSLAAAGAVDVGIATFLIQDYRGRCGDTIESPLRESEECQAATERLTYHATVLAPALYVALVSARKALALSIAAPMQSTEATVQQAVLAVSHTLDTATRWAASFGWTPAQTPSLAP
jgi:hypothetical protein